MRLRSIKCIAWMPLLALAAAVLPQNAFPADKQEIRIAGGSTALGSMQLLADAFRGSHPGIRFRIYPGIGSAGGFKALAAGAIDIGLMGRPLQGDETSAGLSSTEYARTPLAFIAGDKVGISGVTTEEMVRIYRGETATWPDGEPVRPVLYSASDPDTALIKQISPAMSEAVDIALARQGMIIASSTQNGYDKVKQVPGSIGFCSLTKVLTEREPVKILSYNGVLPSVKNLRNGSYPLFKPLYLVVKPNPRGPVREFLRFIRSPDGQRILEQAGDMAIKERSAPGNQGKQW